MGMWNSSLAIDNPFGISVYGSAVMRVPPDLASITAAVTRLEKKPSEAFSNAKHGAHAVAEFLRGAGISDFGTSRISLFQESRLIAGEHKLLGYRASIGFTVELRALEKTEEIITGMVDSGANEVRSVEFRISKLKDLRMEARRIAIGAAREKAEVYANAANVSLDKILHIQDVNPQVLQRGTFHQISGGVGGSFRDSSLVDSEPQTQTLDPEAVEVGAVVLVAYALRPKD